MAVPHWLHANRGLFHCLIRLGLLVEDSWSLTRLLLQADLCVLQPRPLAYQATMEGTRFVSILLGLLYLRVAASCGGWYWTNGLGLWAS